MQIGLSIFPIINSCWCPLDTQEHIHFRQHGRTWWSIRPAAAFKAALGLPIGRPQHTSDLLLVSDSSVSPPIHYVPAVVSPLPQQLFFLLFLFASLHLCPHFFSCLRPLGVIGGFVFHFSMIYWKGDGTQS